MTASALKHTKGSKESYSLGQKHDVQIVSCQQSSKLSISFLVVFHPFIC